MFSYLSLPQRAARQTVGPQFPEIEGCLPSATLSLSLISLHALEGGLQASLSGLDEGSTYQVPCPVVFLWRTQPCSCTLSVAAERKRR